MDEVEDDDGAREGDIAAMGASTRLVSGARMRLAAGTEAGEEERGTGGEDGGVVVGAVGGRREGEW